MRSHLCIVAAAALAVGSIGISKTYAEDPNNPKPTVGQKIENAADKTGDALKSGADKTERALGIKKEPGAYQTEHAAAIEKQISEVVDAALTKKGLDDMAERFVDADRNRLGQNQGALKNNDALDGRIAEFQKDWKAKYNQDFDSKSQYDKVFDQSFAMISEGEEIGARTASGKVNADKNTGATPDQVNANNQTGVDKPTSPDADKNLNDKGRNMATVHIAASHGKSALDVPMIHEAGGWKIDIPDSVDATKFRDNVQNALTHCDEMKDKWPADVTDAYRGVTHAVLLAIFDKPLSDAAQSASGTIPPDQGTNPNPSANTSPQPIQPVQPVEPAK
jgi:hypothetical protein